MYVVHFIDACMSKTLNPSLNLRDMMTNEGNYFLICYTLRGFWPALLQIFATSIRSHGHVIRGVHLRFLRSYHTEASILIGFPNAMFAQMAADMHVRLSHSAFFIGKLTSKPDDDDQKYVSMNKISSSTITKPS